MKRKLAKAMALALGISMLAGCGSGPGAKKPDDKQTDSKNEETVKLVIFDKNKKEGTFDELIAKELEKRTGIDIELMAITGGSGEEKASLMLASKDYPDLVLLPFDGPLAPQYIESGAFINLTEHMDKMPNVVERYGDNLKKTRYKDGNNYWLACWYGLNPYDVCYCANLRYDILCEMVGKERADSTEPFSASEFKELLKRFQKEYPEIDGVKTVPLTIWADYYIKAVTGMYGIKQCYVDENGNVHYDFMDPKYIDALHFFNDLYRENLLDKEWISNNKELFDQKASSGTIFGTLGSWYDTQDIDPDNKDTQYRAYKIYADENDPDNVTTAGRSSRGGDLIGVTDNCKNVDAACKLIDYLASQEGQDLMCWGIEGIHYTKEDGKYIPNQEYLDNLFDNVKDTEDPWMSADPDVTGIGKYSYFNTKTPHADGSPARIADCNQTRDPKAAQAIRNLAGTFYDKAEFDDLTPTGNSKEGLKAQKIADIQKEMLAKIVCASTYEEVDEFYADMLEQMRQSGLEEIEAAMNEKYQQRLVDWGMK